jgi:hypothetical protein
METRTIQKLYAGIPTVEGAGVNLTRIFSQPDVYDLDPFLLLDFFDSNNPADYRAGFPMHPHRGIETITYLLKGAIEHQDSLGNKGVIEPYGCQWMTAGRSILHQEMPDPSLPILGTQLWLNLPAAHKMTAPAYRDITESDVPIYKKDGLLVRVLAGTFDGVTGPVRGTYVDPIYLDVTVRPHGTFPLAIPAKITAFIFLLEGRLDFPEGKSVLAPETRGILLSRGEYINIQSGSGARFLIIAGQPLNEPIAWGGPIVMNSQEELHTAFQQLRDGTFIQD